MKRRSLFLVAFLMCLYITPSLFLMSYAGMGIAAPQNTSKEFVVADTWNEAGNVSVGFDTPEWIEAGNISVGFDTFPYGSNPSNQSITEFAETLPDDVLYYPDVGVQEATDGNVTGGAETNDYTYMLEDDGSNWRGSTNANPLYLYFDIDSCIAENVTVSFDALSSSPSTDAIWLYLFNPNGDDLMIAFDSNISVDAVISGEYDIVDWMSYETNGYHTFYFRTTYKAPATVIDADYFHLIPHNGYTESFSDVSDWTVNSGNGHHSSDEDVISLFTPPDSTYTWQYTDIPSVASYESFYYEIRYKRNTTSTSYHFKLNAYKGDAMGGGLAFQVVLPYGTNDWVTTKGIITDTDPVESLALGVMTTSGINWFLVEVDYFRISKSDEMGWQHDMSTLEPISSSGGLIDGASTDGDKINFTNDAGSAAAEYSNIFYDSTSTNAAGSFTYYSFLEISISAVGDAASDDAVWLLRLYDSDGTYENLIGYVDDVGIFRFNLQAITPIDLEYLRLYVHRPDDWVQVDYAKLYSIANYTISQSSTTVNDYLYVSEGVLYSNIDSGNIVIDYDVPLNIERPYYGWGLNSSLGQPQVDFYNASDGWLGYSSESEGQLPYNSNIIDVRFRFSDIGNITSLTFFDSSGWRDTGLAAVLFRIKSWISITIAIIRFFIEAFSRFSFTAFFILAGLIMIPVSTIFLVKGGRSEMSNDKLFLFLMIFLFGWAFFLGGIL